MDKFVIRGNKPLCGEVTVSGAKNAIVAIIPATIMVDGLCRIENVPQVSDVIIQLEILQQMGARVRSVNPSTVEIDCRGMRNARTPEDLMRRLRASSDRRSAGPVSSGGGGYARRLQFWRHSPHRSACQGL